METVAHLFVTPKVCSSTNLCSRIGHMTGQSLILNRISVCVLYTVYLQMQHEQAMFYGYYSRLYNQWHVDKPAEI